jgi:hypothetical protein
MRVNFELLDERSQMRRNGSLGGVVLLFKALAHGCECDTPLKSGIDLHMSGTGNNVPTYPVIDPVGSGRDCPWPGPTVSTSRFAPAINACHTRRSPTFSHGVQRTRRGRVIAVRRQSEERGTRQGASKIREQQSTASCYRAGTGDPMRLPIVATTTATFLLAQTVFAQNAPSDCNQAAGVEPEQNAAQLQQAKIERTLQGAGFTDIETAPTAFLVREPRTQRASL